MVVVGWSRYVSMEIFNGHTMDVTSKLLHSVVFFLYDVFWLAFMDSCR